MNNRETLGTGLRPQATRKGAPTVVHTTTYEQYIPDTRYVNTSYDNRKIYVYVCLSIFRTFANFSLRTKDFSAKHQMRGHMKPGRTHWSRSRRDPCTLERVAGAQTFFSAGVDKTISLVSIREAFFCTYVPLKCRHFFGPSCTRSTYR